MSTNNFGKKIKRGETWLDRVIGIGLGIALPVFAWSKRPLELREASDQTLLILKDSWVLKPIFFYASFIIAVGLIAYGINKLRSLDKKE